MKGRVAIITASSTGIGKATATRLAEEGVKVIISSRDQKNVDAAVSQLQAKGHEAHGIVCHVGKKEDREKLINETIDKYGRIDYLVPNAAVSLRSKDYFQADEGQIQKMLDINYKSTFFLIKSAIPHLKKQKGSAIVIMSTYSAFEIPMMAGHYAISKLMLVGMTKVVSRILLQDQIRVNCVCPGVIYTQFSKYLWETEEYQTFMKKRIGIKRYGQTQQISGAIKFLLSEDASYITGQCMVIAGRPGARL